MSITKHTPAPWNIFRSVHNGLSITDKKGDCLCDLYIVIDSETDNIKPYRNYEGNANLIAAAPELLSFAELVAAGHLSREGFIDAAKRVVAKAKGESI